MLIEESAGFLVAGEASNGKALLQAVGTMPLDLVLLDLSMPGMSGFEVLKQIKACRPDLPVVVLSMFSETQYVDRALSLGASGYLTKEGPPGELVAGMHAVMEGHCFISRCIREPGEPFAAGEAGAQALQNLEKKVFD